MVERSVRGGKGDGLIAWKGDKGRKNARCTPLARSHSFP